MSTIQASAQMPLHRATWSFPSSYNLNSNPSSATLIPTAALGSLQTAPYTNVALNTSSFMNATNMSFTTPYDGEYIFNLSMKWQTSGANSTVVVYIVNNSNNIYLGYALLPVWTSANLFGVCYPVVGSGFCKKGDVISFYYQLGNYQNTNFNLQGVQLHIAQLTTSAL